MHLAVVASTLSTLQLIAIVVGAVIAVVGAGAFLYYTVRQKTLQIAESTIELLTNKVDALEGKVKDQGERLHTVEKTLREEVAAHELTKEKVVNSVSPELGRQIIQLLTEMKTFIETAHHSNELLLGFISSMTTDIAIDSGVAKKLADLRPKPDAK